jgi:hypothetical protein
MYIAHGSCNRAGAVTNLSNHNASISDLAGLKCVYAVCRVCDDATHWSNSRPSLVQDGLSGTATGRDPGQTHANHGTHNATTRPDPIDVLCSMQAALLPSHTQQSVCLCSHTDCP